MLPRRAEEQARPRIAVKRIGRQPPFRVFLHGFGANAGTFQGLLAALHGTGAAILLDLPGHGGSTVPDRYLAPEEMAHALAEVLLELELGPLHFVGHSLGGLVATHIAAMHPNRVQRLSLISCAGVGPDLNLPFFEAFVSARSIADLMPALSIAYARPPQDLAKVARTLFSWLEKPGVRPYLDAIVHAAPGFRAPIERAFEAGVDVHAIWGARDGISPIANASSLPRGLQPTVLAEVGHLPHIEAPAEVARWLTG
jgi:pyruvate dehydrogenase E2 component (dihydrolipoamide acetyltransferase)